MKAILVHGKATKVSEQFFAEKDNKKKKKIIMAWEDGIYVCLEDGRTK